MGSALHLGSSSKVDPAGRGAGEIALSACELDNFMMTFSLSSFPPFFFPYILFYLGEDGWDQKAWFEEYEE